MRKMNEEDCAKHHDDEADRADAEKHSGEDGDSAGDLRQTHEVAHSDGLVHEGGKASRAGAAEGSEEDGAAVIEERESAGDANQKKSKAELRRAGRTGWEECVHGGVSLLCRNGVSKIRVKAKRICWGDRGIRCAKFRGARRRRLRVHERRGRDAGSRGAGTSG